jgi:transposase
MNEKPTEVYVGIDVSKTQLDVAIGKDGAYWQASNDAVGIRKVLERLTAIQPVLIVVESTGGLELALITELYAAGLPFALVHPGRVRAFARSIGLLAKTDKLDARLLAQFGEAVKPPLTRLPGEAEQYLNALLLRRRQLLDMLVDEKNHLVSTRLDLRSKKKCRFWMSRSLTRSAKSLASRRKKPSCAALKGWVRC